MNTIKYHSKSEQRRVEAIEKEKVVSSPQVQGSQLPTSGSQSPRKPKYRYYHEACSNTAFLLFEKPIEGAPAISSNACHTDGRPVNEGDAVICDSCLNKIPYLNIGNVLPL